MTNQSNYKQLALLVLLSSSVYSCPYLDNNGGSASGLRGRALHSTKDVADTPVLPKQADPSFAAELAKLDWTAVKDDIKTVMTTSENYWPADYGNYGPLFIRLAWHCNGSYRTTDGRGGCDGGNQRFDPVRSWEDNTNLDKARRLLEPVKLKYGIGLSYGDLYTLAGTTAIEAMGGPVLGFCAGRIDDVNNEPSLLLGPTPQQESYAPCETEGNCTAPLGTEKIGLIYVNPEGPMGVPDPVGSAKSIRNVFSRMGMGDEETVALIGGGHAFGKSHGACPAGAGPSPEEDPFNSWPGMCGTGRGNDTYTSGIEGPWTQTPTKWDNDYFKNLMDYDWEVHTGPGGHYQWRVVNGTSPAAPVAYPPSSKGLQDIMFLTSDVALKNDPNYTRISDEFSRDLDALNKVFAPAWYKLMSGDMGPATRCVGPNVPPPQPFQFPLPPPPKNLASEEILEAAVEKVLTSSIEANLEPLFIRLAWQCASTYRHTDYSGGCNGARIRFQPGKSWTTNAGLERALSLLDPIVQNSEGTVTHADLIVIAGNTALKKMGISESDLPFCGGRSDDTTGVAWEKLSLGNAEYPSTINEMKEQFQRRGFTMKEMVALMGGGYRIGQTNPATAVHTLEQPRLLSTTFLSGILSNQWKPVTSNSSTPSSSSSPAEFYVAIDDKSGKETYAHFTDLALVYYPELATWANYYVGAGEKVFKRDFAAAWTKLMNADRFDGPTGNVCSSPPYSSAPSVEVKDNGVRAL